MASKRLFQLIAAKEEQAGVVAPGLIALANAKILVSDPQVTYDRATFERAINRTSLTPLTPIEGVVEANLTCRVELAGTSAGAGTAPDWSILLQACGLRERVLTKTTIDAVATSNAFYSGEDLNISSVFSGEVVHDTWAGATTLYQAEWNANGAIVGEQSAATAASSANASDGFAWTPRSRPTVDLDGVLVSGVTPVVAGTILIGNASNAIFQVIGHDFGGGDITGESTGTMPIQAYVLDPGDFVAGGETLNDINGDPVIVLDSTGSVAISQDEVPALSMAVIEDGVQRILKGCRGSVTFTANIGEPMYMDFDFKGLISSITDGQLSGTPVPNAKVPPSFLEISYGVAKDSPVVAPADMHTPCINSWSLEFANEVAIEKCAASTDGTRGSAILTGRSVTGSLDPSVRPEASFPFLDAFRNGDVFRQRLTLGDTAANQFHLSVPACQLTSEGGGDRDGIATRDLQFSASGRTEDGTDREDREFILTYHDVATYSD